MGQGQGCEQGMWGKLSGGKALGGGKTEVPGETGKGKVSSEKGPQPQASVPGRPGSAVWVWPLGLTLTTVPAHPGDRTAEHPRLVPVPKTGSDQAWPLGLAA